MRTTLTVVGALVVVGSVLVDVAEPTGAAGTWVWDGMREEQALRGPRADADHPRSRRSEERLHVEVLHREIVGDAVTIEVVRNTCSDRLRRPASKLSHIRVHLG